MDEVKLLPCPIPWCAKSKPELMQGGFRNGSYIVRCQTCGCETPRYYGTDRAVATWNTRAIEATRPPIADEVVERVAEAALKAIAEQAEEFIPPDSRDQRLAWIDAELEAEPSRSLYGSDDEPAFRNGHEITELIAERAGLIAQIALAKIDAAMPAIPPQGLGADGQGKRPRIPTPEMIAAAWAVIEASKKATGIAKLGPGLGVREIWQAMYDAASETPTPGPAIDQDGGEG